MAVKAFKKGYPYVNALYQLSILAHYIGYLYNKTPFYSPWLRLIGIEVKRMSAADYVSCPILFLSDRPVSSTLLTH